MGEPAIIVATADSLKGGGGGVQVCTNDYLYLLTKAGFDLKTVTFESDQRWLTKLLRRLEGRPYRRLIPSGLPNDVAEAIHKSCAKFVFFNLIGFPTILPWLRRRFGSTVKLVHLSHGLDSTDMCVSQQSEQEFRKVFKHDNWAARQHAGSSQLCVTGQHREMPQQLGTGNR